MQARINLIGLPGAGKTGVYHALLSFFKSQKIAVELTNNSVDEINERVNWLVIDIRAKLFHLQAEKYLVDAANQSSLIILNFAEASALDVQMFWQNWKISNARHLPVVRLFHSAFKSDFQWQAFLSSPTKNIPPNLKLEVLKFKVGKINLDHLMAGLDACKQNLQMDIWRIKGAIQTTEYTNPVALEVSVNRWDTFAINEATGEVHIKGFKLDEFFLAEVIQASQL